MSRLRVAGIGAGYFSRFHLAGWTAIDDVELVGWCDSDRAKAQAGASAHGIPHAFDDAAAMLDALRPDLVDIVTPPATHRALVALAAERGLATICQKALAPTHDDAGTLGVPHSVAFRLRPGDGQGPQAYLDRQPYFQRMPRFLVYETAIHWIDTFRVLMGEVEAVTARLRRVNPAIDGEDAGHIVFGFANDAGGLFDGNRLNDHASTDPRRTMGEMWLDGEARLWWRPHGGGEAAHGYDRGDAATFGGGCCEALQRHVVAHPRDGAPLENRGRDYLVNLDIQEAVYASHTSGRRIALSAMTPAHGSGYARGANNAAPVRA